MTRATTADSVEVAVHDLGGTGPPLLLAHATSFHGLVWRPLAASLTGSFRCISFDARGHGDSALPPDGDFDWNGLALDALAVVDACGLEAPFGLGHSSGGSALLLAEQARPGTFRALYCFEPVVVPVEPPLGRDPGNWLAAAARRRRQAFDSREAALAHYSSKPALAALARDALEAYVEHGFEDVGDGTVRLRCRPETEAQVHEMASAHDCFSHLPEVSCPVRLACGSASDAIGPAGMEALASRLPQGRTEVLPGLGHLGPLEDPPAVAGSARRFFSEVLAAST